MEILSNFSSMYCLISFVIGAVLMLVALAIAAVGKDYDEPRNNVRFFVKAVRDDMYWLYIKDKKGNISFIGLDEDFNNLWGLNPDDFSDMKKGEIREVYLDLKD